MGLGEAAFKKALQTREHRERSQPASRKRLGLLEKHKDYVKRARNFSKKQSQLKALRLIASQRNPDEFNTGMIKGRLIKNKHITNFVDESKAISKDVIDLMKSQDIKYIQMKRRANKKHLDVLERECVDPAIKPNSHIIFAEDEGEAQKIIKDALDNDENNENTDDDLDDIDALLKDSKTATRKDRRLEELKIRRQRDALLRSAENKLMLDKRLLKKGKRVKIGVDTDGVPMYKWNVERSK